MAFLRSLAGPLAATLRAVESLMYKVGIYNVRSTHCRREEKHAVPRRSREHSDGVGPRRDARLRCEDHGQPVRTPGGDAAVGGGARKGHVQARRTRHRRHHAGAGGGTSLRTMLAGELPYAEIATSAAIAGTLAGVELKAVASSSNHIGELTWAAKPDAGIASIKDLVGKKVAYTSPKSITEMVIRTALKQEGLTGKVEILPLG